MAAIADAMHSAEAFSSGSGAGTASPVAPATGAPAPATLRQRTWVAGLALLTALAFGGAGDANASSKTFTHTTNKGSSCSVRVYGIAGGGVSYGIETQGCESKRGVRSVRGGSFLLDGAVKPIPGTVITDHGHAPFGLQGSYSGSDARYFRADFAVTLRSPQTRWPERWRRRGVPRGCRVVTHERTRDSLLCAFQGSVTTAG